MLLFSRQSLNHLSTLQNFWCEVGKSPRTWLPCVDKSHLSAESHELECVKHNCRCNGQCTALTSGRSTSLGSSLTPLGRSSRAALASFLVWVQSTLQHLGEIFKNSSLFLTLPKKFRIFTLKEENSPTWYFARFFDSLLGMVAQL